MILEKQHVLERTMKYNQISGVYFLISGGEIVYVGQSTDVINRVSNHFNHSINDKIFDSYAVVECDPALLNDLEAEYIVRFAPIYNKHLPVNSRWFTPPMLKKELCAALPDIKRYANQHGVAGTNGYYDIGDFAQFNDWR